MTRRVAVIGAGLAGITAARRLAARGHEVTVLEKSPGFGGRLATRRVEAARIDHGAPCFTVRDPDFRTELAPLLDAGVVRPWFDRLHRWDGTTLAADPLMVSERRFAAPDGMNAIVKALSQGLDVRLDTRVASVRVDGAGWRLALAEGEPLEADLVVVAIPAPQALALVGDTAIDDAVREDLARVQFDPCLVVLAGYDAPAPGWRAIQSSAEPLQWIGRESDKRPSSGVQVAIHATRAWSRAHWDLPDAEVTARLLEAASLVGGAFLARPAWSQLKRWRYAKPVVLATARALLSERGAPIVFAGDWCQAPRVEGAFQSGVAAADRLIFAGYA